MNAEEKKDNHNKNPNNNKIYTKKNLNYYRLNIKSERKVKDDNYIENNDYNKKLHEFKNMNKIGIKRILTNFDLEINKKEILTNKENNILDFQYNSKNKNRKNEYLGKSISTKTKTKR